jgi:hypothetical protein
VDWLNKFLSQVSTGDLKTAHYPREYGSFKMKVSFGQGVQARVPWVSFVAQGMSTSNGYYPVYLYYKDISKLILAYGVSETDDFGKGWREDILDDAPQIKDVVAHPPRYGDSWVFRSYDVVIINGTAQVSFDGQPMNDDDMKVDLDLILGQYGGNLDEELIDKDSPLSAGLFYMEKQLEDFILENWSTSELGKRYELLYQEGVLISQQYRTGIGPIDILVRDKVSQNYVVIELKRNQTSDDTLGQILRYMGWVSEHLDNPSVHGVIIAGKYDEKLHYAQLLTPNVDVYLYEVRFSLREHNRN